MQNLYQNYAPSNGDCPDDTTALAASSPTQSVDSAGGGSRTLNFLLGKNKPPATVELEDCGNGTVHRIRDTASDAQPEPLCALGCCGRGSFFLMWAVSLAFIIFSAAW